METLLMTDNQWTFSESWYQSSDCYEVKSKEQNNPDTRTILCIRAENEELSDQQRC